jgi:aryl-alcohol dehydrogenase-like predicted oxidoreductase
MEETMRYKLLGHSGLRVSEACLGTMTFGETWGWGASAAESKKMFDLFAEAGGNFIDTSVNYTDGTAEEFLGDLLHADRDHFVVATKYSLTKPDNADPNGGGNSRKNMMKSVEKSLKHLKTDHIDLYYLHMWDYMTPVEEVARGLDDLIKQGKVLYAGFSDTPDYIVAEANTRAELMGWSRFIAMQVPYSLLDRSVERSLIPMAHHWDMTVLAWGLLEAGILTGKFLKNVSDPTRINQKELKLSEKSLAIVKEVEKISQETGKSMSQVTINWIRQNPEAHVMPILGARSGKQLKDNLEAMEWTLSEEQYKRLDKVSAIEAGFPHNIIKGNEYIFGATFDKIDNHRV